MTKLRKQTSRLTKLRMYTLRETKLSKWTRIETNTIKTWKTKLYLLIIIRSRPGSNIENSIL